jgi:hypothetical protein
VPPFEFENKRTPGASVSSSAKTQKQAVIVVESTTVAPRQRPKAAGVQGNLYILPSNNLYILLIDTF